MNKLKLTTISVTSGVIFTMLIYNINFSQYIYRYLFIAFFYFLLFSFVYIKNRNFLFSFLVVAGIPVLIDASVLITFPGIIPLRFPYATTFILLGIAGGFIYSIKKWGKLIIFALLLSAYSIIGHRYIIPEILYSILHRADKPNMSNTFLNNNFYTIDLKQIKITDTLLSKCNLVELFFVGCPPCEQKLPLLTKLISFYKKKDFNVIMICDGSITPWEDFVAYHNKSLLPNATYLYDKDSILYKYRIKQFPTEIMTSRRQIFYTETGYSKESLEIYFKNKTNRINSIIYEMSKK